MEPSEASPTPHVVDRSRSGRRDAPDDGSGRRADFEALARAVHGPVTRYVRRRAGDAADDVVAETLLVAWRRFDEIPRGAELPWCYGVARRCLANQRRGDARRLRLVDEIRHERVYREPSTAADGDPDLEAALDALDAPDRELLRLWAWEGLAPREIAIVMGVTPNAASIRLHRARRRLEAALGDVGRRKDPDRAGHQLHEGTKGDGR
ncbi:MAG: RNA polymerase sigma factor [Acidimicrobiales bacterium]